MDETTHPLPETIEDEYGMDPPIRNRGTWRIRPFPRWMKRRLQFVEPVMILSMAVSSIFGTVQTNAVEFQYCKAVLKIYNSSTCLNTTAPYFTEVQKYTSTFSMFQVLYDSIFPVLFSVFVGPWSDKFGRRPVILSSSIGYLLSSCLWVWGSSTNIHPNYFLLFGLPSSLCGGAIMPVSAMFCYVCDITTLDSRAQRLGILQGCIYLGTLIGTLVTPHLTQISYPFTFSVTVYANALKLLYVMFILKESVDTSEAQQTPMSKNPFQWCYVKSLYEAFYLKQTSHTFQILLYVSLLGLVSLTQAFGEMEVFYLFLQNVLHWSIIEYTPLNCISIVASAYISGFGTWILSRFLGLADMQIINIVNGFRLFGALTLAFGRHIWLIYVGCVLKSAASIYGGMMRVFLSRIISSEDLGKIFALFGTLDILTPLLGSFLYNTVYNATLNTYPNSIFVISSFLCLLLTLFTAKIVHLYLLPSNGSRLSSTTASINS